MTDLEQYIRDHASAFDAETPAEGHEERFLARLDESAPAEAAIRQPRFAIRRLRPANPLAPSLALAFAALAAVVLLIRPGDPFRGVSNDPETIYLAYMDRVAELYRTPSAGDSEWRDATLASITEEDEPLFAQLPEELSTRERGRILKTHYGELLAAARQLK